MELTDYIAEDLRGRIQSGAELPGRLTLSALAKHYGVSLTPVRGAVTRLIADACLEKLPNGRLTAVSGRRRLRKPPPVVAPPPTARDWDRAFLREVMFASLNRTPVHLREEALARKHGIGRSVVRQSLGRLAGAGLIEHIPRRGWKVHSIQEDDIAAYLEVREILELKALDLAQPHLQAADLRQILEGNRPGRDNRSPQLDNRLHEYLILKSGNRYIQNFFRQYTATYYASVFDYAAPEAHLVAKMAAQHRSILRALLEKNWVRAREALAQHIRAQRVVLTQLLQKDTVRQKVPGTLAVANTVG